jgi:glutamate-1-semialdehyde 2,1-aminomutase
LTVSFRYNDLNSLIELFDRHPDQIACVVMEAEATIQPNPGYLQQVKDLCEQRGTVLIFDEMITGFRWHLGGAQEFHRVVPHLSTFGKGLGNGFAISALAGKRDIMRLGGLDHDRPRVFLLSTTHGAEMHTYVERDVIEVLWRQGELLRKQVAGSINEHRLNGYFEILGRPCNLIFATRDLDRKPSQKFRTLFMQEMIRRGVIGPSFVVSYAHSDADIQWTAEAAHEALAIYRKALDEGVEKYLQGRPVKPVSRRFN